MPTAIKAQWTIYWGMIQGEPTGEKLISYTSEDYDQDQLEQWKQGDLSRFERLRLEALGVSQAMQNGAINNWVQTDFIWY